MATLVRERRHQKSLRLSLPPPVPASNFRSPTYSPAASPAASPVFSTLSEFEKLAVLGRGNGGTVYKVLHRATSSIYALKVLCGTREQASREAEILRRVADSPFAVRCHGVFESPNSGDASVLMEFVEGGSVLDLLRARQRLPEQEISGILARVLLGLKYLHERGIVHGDIKPSNLLVGPGSGQAKIADFGASRLAPAGDWDGEGTCAYMSPERFDRERWGGGGEGFAGDVWAVGVVVLECYVGRFPLVGPGKRPDWAALICLMCFGDGVLEFSPETQNASPEFRSFVGRCLEKDWRKRATVHELLQHSFLDVLRINLKRKEK